MKCLNCGEELPVLEAGEQLNFCPFCGIKIDPAAIAAAEFVEESVAEATEEAAEIVEDAVAEEASEPIEETVSEAAEAAELVEETVAEAAEEAAEPAKKKSKLPLIILIVVVVLAAAGYFIYQSLPSTKVGKLLKQANASAAAGSFEEALDSISKAREILPEDLSVIKAGSDTYRAYAQSVGKDGDLSKMFELYRSAVEAAGPLGDEDKQACYDAVGNDLDAYVETMTAAAAFPDAENVIRQKMDIVPGTEAKGAAQLLDLYTKWTDYAAAQNDPDLLLTHLERLGKLKADSAMSASAAEIAELEYKTGYRMSCILLGQAGKQIKSSLDSGLTYKAANDVYLQIINSMGQGYIAASWALEDPEKRLPLVGDIEGTDEKIGLYKSGNSLFVYIGKYEGGKRSGEGVWMTYMGSPISSYRQYCAKGTWADDLPNGSVEIWDCLKNSSSEESLIRYKANVKNGIFEGEAEVEFNESGILYHPNYENDYAKLVEEHTQNGTTYYIISFDASGTKFMHNPNYKTEQNCVLGTK